MIEVKVVENDWRESRKRAIVSVTPAVDVQEPTGPLCSDMECESYSCKVAHEFEQMLEFMSREQALRGLGLGHCVDRRWKGEPWVPQAEVDHSVWKKYRAKGIQLRRVIASRAMTEGLMPEMTLSWDDKAGCGCGCSPGFRTGGQVHGRWFFVKEVVG